jgi:2-polyprenyl-3-methyl-5-hydroxy-6-metoxy-1,4-benzoquinol methylase
MSSLPEIVCVCCGNRAVRQFDASPLDYCLDKKFDIYRCVNCGHGITGNIEKNDLLSLYEEGAYDPKEKFWHKILRPLLNSFEISKVNYLNSNKQEGKLLLEIGTGKGSFLHSAVKAGYDAYGIEPSTRSYKIAKSKCGERVFQCTLEEMHLRVELNKKFDFIFLWHVLEHLHEPENTVRILKSFLKPNGILIVGVPNFDSYQSKIGKSNWYHLDPPRHLSHFTPHSIDIFLQKNSLAVRRIFFNSFFQNMLGDIITINNLLLPHKNILLNFLRVNNFYFKKTSPSTRIVNLLGFALITTTLIIPSILCTLSSQLLKKSGTMVVIAQNNFFNK